MTTLCIVFCYLLFLLICILFKKEVFIVFVLHFYFISLLYFILLFFSILKGTYCRHSRNYSLLRLILLCFACKNRLKNVPTASINFNLQTHFTQCGTLSAVHTLPLPFTQNLNRYFVRSFMRSYSLMLFYLLTLFATTYSFFFSLIY